MFEKYLKSRMRAREFLCEKFFMPSELSWRAVCLIRVSIFDRNGTIYYRMKEKLIIVLW